MIKVFDATSVITIMSLLVGYCTVYQGFRLCGACPMTAARFSSYLHGGSAILMSLGSLICLGLGHDGVSASLLVANSTAFVTFEISHEIIYSGTKIVKLHDVLTIVFLFIEAEGSKVPIFSATLCGEMLYPLELRLLLIRHQAPKTIEYMLLCFIGIRFGILALRVYFGPNVFFIFLSFRSGYATAFHALIKMHSK